MMSRKIKEKEKETVKEKKPLNKRKIKYGSASAAITVLFTAAVVLLNVLASQMTDRFGLKLDTTQDQIFEISQDTKDYIDTLEEKVDISVMVSEDTLDSGNKYYKLAKEITEKYDINGKNITVSYYDAEKNPDVINRFKSIYDGSVSAGDIVVSCDSRVKVISINDLYETAYSQSGETTISLKAEQALTSAIMFVADPNPPVIAVLDVQLSETVAAAFNGFEEMLKNNGYSVVSVNPLEQEISTDYSMVILPSPQKDLSESVISKIDAYLYNDGKLGKNLFYFANFDQGETPKLDEFLEEWGIAVGEGYVQETDPNATVRDVVGGLGGYAEFGLSSLDVLYSYLVSASKPLIEMPYPRPVELLFGVNDDRETSAILVSSESSVIVTKDITTAEQFNELKKSSSNVLVRGSKHIYQDDEQISSNVIVSGSAYMADYYVLNSAANNQEFFINLVNTYTGKEKGVTILSKSLDYDRFTLDAGGEAVIRIIIMILIPMAVAAAGIIVFLRRRNK